MVALRRLFSALFILSAGALVGHLLFGKASTAGHSVLIILPVIVLLVTTGIPIVMAFLPCSGFFMPVICRGMTDQKTASITFDDGPDPAGTPRVLAALRRHGLKATFFCTGRNLEAHRELALAAHREGHLIGNHSCSHSYWFDLLPATAMRRELDRTDSLIKEITGKMPLFFRPPYGVVNPLLGKALKNMHWRTVCWNIRTFDTTGKDPQRICRKVTSRLVPGSVILLHDHTNFSADHLDDLFSAILNAGYRIVPLDKLLNMPAYAG